MVLQVFPHVFRFELENADSTTFLEESECPFVVQRDGVDVKINTMSLFDVVQTAFDHCQDSKSQDIQFHNPDRLQVVVVIIGNEDAFVGSLVYNRTQWQDISQFLSAKCNAE